MAKHTIEPNDRHREFMAAVKEAMLPFGDLTPPEILALLSQLVGNTIALQNQFTMTPDQAMRIVVGNIEIGNQVAVASMSCAGSA